MLGENVFLESHLQLLWAQIQKKNDLETRYIIYKLLGNIAGELKQSHVFFLIRNIEKGVDFSEVTAEEIKFIYDICRITPLIQNISK